MQTLLSIADAAAALGISRVRVQVLISTGRLPASRVGNQYIIRKADLAKVRDRKPGRPRKAKK